MGKSKSVNSTVYHLFVTIVGVFMLYPVLWTLASSLKPENEIFVNAASLLPSKLVWQNYADGWKGFGTYGFSLFFRNSVIVTMLTVIGTLFSTALVSYGFARLRFRFKPVLFVCLLATLMLPGQVTLIPQYILFHKMNWINTYLPLVVPSFIGGSAFFIFLMIQFIRGIPKELDQASVIDGCGTFGTFRHVILPLTLPALATVSIFCFYWTWTDFFGPLIYINKPELYTVSLGLRMFADPSSVTAWGPMFAMSMLSLLPVFIIFLFLQKYLVQGIATTGLKG
jgi:multiple sugar transport system permease protein